MGWDFLVLSTTELKNYQFILHAFQSMEPGNASNMFFVLTQYLNLYSGGDTATYQTQMWTNKTTVVSLFKKWIVVTNFTWSNCK